MTYYSNTPPNQDAYSLYMTRKFDERDVMDIPSAFRAFWANARPQYCPDSSAFSADIIRGNRRMTELIRRGDATVKGVSVDQKRLVDGQWTNITRQFPLAEEKSVLTASRLNFRQPGESAYGSMDRQARLREMFRTETLEHVRKISRLCEYLAATVMQSATQEYIIGNSTDIIDYRRHASNTVACTNTWNSGSGTPLTDLASACAKVQLYGKVKPDMCVMDAYSAAAFVSEENLQAFASVTGFSFIRAGLDTILPSRFQRFVDGGFVYLGRVMLPEGYVLDIFVTNDTYDNSSGTSTSYMTAKTSFVCRSDAQYDLIIGPPEVMPKTTIEQQLYEELLGMVPGFSSLPQSNIAAMPAGSLYHDLFFGPDRKSVVCRTQMAPVYVPTMVDSVCTLSNCAT